MSKQKPAKTSGTEWLYLSMASFNGSGYADKSSPEAYVESYKLFKAWKKKPLAVQAAKQFSDEAHFFAEKLVEANPPGITPNQKNIDKFRRFCEQTSLML